MRGAGPSGTDAARRKGERLSRAIRALGPTYIKLGQFLSTRPDVVGPQLANALGTLRDRLPPFPAEKAKAEIEAAFGKPWTEVYSEFGPPVAAASIAQVHKAAVPSNGSRRAVAVKILRPGIEKRFERDLESFYFAARAAERFSPQSRRLRPVAAVETLAQTVLLEMDLRLEAAAISEMAGNIEKAGDRDFRVPKVDWERTSKRVMTLEWIDGIPLTNAAAIESAGLDRKTLGLNVIRSFLKHAIRDGFFHADMHQGNLFVDPRDAVLIAVDFGIMGRIGARERRFLAEILYGFITKNYRRIAEVHFEAGYVPPTQDVAAFAQALRAVGEPIMGRPAAEISMARLLTQLFEVTDLFQMRMRPELLLLQKTMVVVEGVGRSLDSNLNIWMAAEPIVREWIEQQLGPGAQVRDVVAGAGALAVALRQAPQLLEHGTRLAQAMSESARVNAPLESAHRGRIAMLVPLWIGAIALIAMAVKVLSG
jgi:ubiquinone biosynthesis protein